jgi:hypothetical protein
MRRSDTVQLGDAGEIEVAELLTLRGWVVKNLNETKKNNPTYDLQATQGQVCLDISVKVARSKNRHLRLGSVASLGRLTDEAFIIALLSIEKGREIDIPAKDYEVWIIPGIAKHEAIAVHNYYHSGNPNSRAARTTGPILKDKNDRVGGRSISGATFHKWRSLYKDAWHLLDNYGPKAQ